ncbi:MAG: acyl-CoA thioesterase [Actinobacteria bacterium]|nr:acyl-CoA thioesterase [Actinomycetota bacterium]
MARAKVDIQLRWGDEDAYGHINNVAFLRYLEEARVRILWSGSGHEKTGMEGHFRGDTPGGLKTLVVDHRIEYLQVLEYSENSITIELWVGKLGGSSMEVHYEIVDGASAERRVVVRAVTTMVVVDGETLRPQRLSEAARASIEPWRDEPVKLRHR